MNKRLFARLAAWALLLWGADLFLVAPFPPARLLVDPLLLFLIFLGLALPSGRFLWAIGGLLGFLRDLGTGSPMGGFTCAFALVGWILDAGRRFLEREDPLVQGIWAGVLTGLGGLVYSILIRWMDPAMGWNGWAGWILPWTMGIHGAGASLFFPRLRKVLSI